MILPGGAEHGGQNIQCAQETVQDDERDARDAGRIQRYHLGEQREARLEERPVRHRIQDL